MNLGKENETTEFKESLAQLDKGILSISAMLNKHNHGTVFIGVSNDGTVIGTQVGDDTLEKVRNRITTMIEPKIIPQIDVLKSDDGSNYIKITASGYAPGYSFNGRYYTREITSNVSLSPDLLTHMLLSKGTDPARDIPSPIQDLTFLTFRPYLETKNIHTSEEKGFLESHGMMNRDGKFNIVAYLMSDQNDVPLQIVKFSGTEKSSMSSRDDLGRCCLLVGVQKVIDKIGSLQITNVDLSRGARIEMPLFDMDAFREAWVNACVHNDWRSMIPPSVFVFDDRIEVQSYGRIPFMLSLEEFYSGKSIPVNKSLFDLFVLVDYSEQSGHGVKKIVDRYGRDSIDMGSDIITVTIPFAFVPDWVIARRQSESSKLPLNENTAKVVDYLKNNRHAKIKQISEDLEIPVPTINAIIAKLKKYGLIVNDGNTRINDWRVL